MNRYSRGRRSSEQGQALILALAFVAFFGLVIGSILNLGDVTALQHGLTEATASKDSLAEGGAALAAADAGNPNVILTCEPGNSGSLTMQHGDTVGYTVNRCNPATLGTQLGEGCLLCILNLAPGSPSTSVLDMRCGDCSGAALTTSGGNDYINGSITRGLLAATPVAPVAARIEIPVGATTDASCCDPIPVQYAPAISVPLSNGPAPTVANEPAGCTSWDPNAGCTEQLSAQGDYTVSPGLWASLTINDKANVTMTSGVYVFAGGLSITGRGTVTGNDVTIYLACSTYGSTGKACATAGSIGGFINFAGEGSTTITGPAPGQRDTIAADPNLLDPGGATACRQSGTGCLYADGSGASITGTVDTRSGGVSIVGDGGSRINSGRLITNSLYINVLGDVGSGLTLSGPATTSTNACGVFDDTVRGTRGATTSGGRAIVQSHCSGTSGVVAFNYTP